MLLCLLSLLLASLKVFLLFGKTWCSKTIMIFLVPWHGIGYLLGVLSLFGREQYQGAKDVMSKCIFCCCGAKFNSVRTKNMSFFKPKVQTDLSVLTYQITTLYFHIEGVSLLSRWEKPLVTTKRTLSSCLWIIHISSLASPFTVLFLASPCLFCAYHLCLFFPVPFYPFSLLPLPTDKPPCDLHFCGSVPVLVVCLVNFSFLFCF